MSAGFWMFVSERPELVEYCPRHAIHSLGRKDRERPGLLCSYSTSNNKLDNNQVGLFLCLGALMP